MNGTTGPPRSGPRNPVNELHDDSEIPSPVGVPAPPWPVRRRNRVTGASYVDRNAEAGKENFIAGREKIRLTLLSAREDPGEQKLRSTLAKASAMSVYYREKGVRKPKSATHT